MTSNKLNIDFCILVFSATKIISWKCHVNFKWTDVEQKAFDEIKYVVIYDTLLIYM